MSKVTHILQFLHQMFNVFALLLDDACNRRRHSSGEISETLRQFAPLSDILQSSIATHLRCGGILTGHYCKFSPDSDSERNSKIG